MFPSSQVSLRPRAKHNCVNSSASLTTVTENFHIPFLHKIHHSIRKLLLALVILKTIISHPPHRYFHIWWIVCAEKDPRLLDTMAVTCTRFVEVAKSFGSVFRAQSLTCYQQRKYSTRDGIKKSTALKKMLLSPELEFLMEAHSGISACIAEEAGFKGIWASGLSISAQLGVRDSNEASWTQVLEVLEFMNDACGVPILVDADTGYGNFNNARRLVRKLEDRGIAGAAVEDKLFPKTNSLLEGRQQPLASVEEFALKIRAMKDSARDPDFCIVARVEALIAGWPMEEALKRADAFLSAGADAILMHSKKKDPSQIEEFLRLWKNKGPVVLVPTTYHTTPTQKFRDWGASVVIWANHSVRASVRAMQDCTARIFREQSISNVEKEIVPVKELFRLTNDNELKEAEDKYLPKA